MKQINHDDDDEEQEKEQHQGSTEKEIDLSAFPLLRLDQLFYAETAILERSLARLSLVVEQHQQQTQQQEKEEQEDPLLSSLTRQYASRQMEAMVKELGNRRPLPPPPPPPPLPPPPRPVAAPVFGPQDFVIRSTRPKPKPSLLRGGKNKNPRVMARARLQQFKAWRQQEEGQKEEDIKQKEPVTDPKPCKAPPPCSFPSPCIPAALSTPLPSPPLPPPPLSSSPSLLVEKEESKADDEEDEEEDDGLVPVYAPPQPQPPPPPPHDNAPTALGREEDRQQHHHEPDQHHPQKQQIFYYRLTTSSSRPEVQSIVADVFAQAFPDWQEWRQQDDMTYLQATGGRRNHRHDCTWHLMWTWCKPRVDYAALLSHQWVNHIPRSRELTRKDLLVRHLNRYLTLTRSGPPLPPPAPPTHTTRTAAFFHVMPQTFVLPQAYTEFLVAFRDTSPQSGGIWILKPIESSRGRGITLIDSLVQVVYSEPVVVQRYIANPLLLDGYKFDLRLYVLVTAFQPTLEAFIYTEGFARLCTQPFQLQDLASPLVHVTNSSVQTRQAIRGPLPKQHPLRTAPPTHVGGSKLRLTHLWERLRMQGVAVDALWQDIVEVVVKSLVAVADAIPPQQQAFELFGYDILLDADLRPWLLEVNASPSLARDHNLDKGVKEAVLADTVRLVHQGELGRYERLCPDTETYRKVFAYTRRFVRTKKGRLTREKKNRRVNK